MQVGDHQDINTASYKGDRLEGKFGSESVINLSRNLFPPEISLLSKGLKFVPRANKIDQVKLKKRVGRIWEDILFNVALPKWWANLFNW